MMDLKNKRILITGASSGIGRQLAFELAQHAPRLVLMARREEKLVAVSNKISERFPGILKPVVIASDVTKNDEVIAAIERMVEQLGGIDILVNNAGIGVYGPLKNTTPGDFKTVMDVNFHGSVNCTLAALPHLLKNKVGMVVFISSVASLHGVPYYSAYCASKAAMRSFSQTLRAELAHTGISVLHVAPDYTETAFFEKEIVRSGAKIHDDKTARVGVVARKIVRHIIRQKKDTVLSFRGQALKRLKEIVPFIVEAVYKQRALKYMEK